MTVALLMVLLPTLLNDLMKLRPSEMEAVLDSLELTPEQWTRVYDVAEQIRDYADEVPR